MMMMMMTKFVSVFSLRQQNGHTMPFSDADSWTWFLSNFWLVLNALLGVITE